MCIATDLNSKRYTFDGHVHAIAVSPNGDFIAGGITSKSAQIPFSFLFLLKSLLSQILSSGPHAIVDINPSSLYHQGESQAAVLWSKSGRKLNTMVC
eukprot:144465-Amorphochlora_amoeboformis.AAC.1